MSSRPTTSLGTGGGRCARAASRPRRLTLAPQGRTADGRVGLFPSTFVSTANVRNVDTADFEAALGRVFPAFRASPRSVAGLAGAGAESQPPSRLGTPEMPHYEPQHVALTAPTVPKQLNHLPFAVAQPPPAARVPLPEPPKPAVAPKVVEVKKTVAVMEHKVFPAREIEPAKPLGPRELPTLASKKPVEAKAATNETTTSSLAAKKPLAGKVTPPSTPAITPPSISPGIKVAPGVAALASRLAAHNSAQAPSSGVREVSLAKSAGQPSLSGVQKLRMLYGDTESVAQAQPRQISADRLEIDRSLFLHETESLAKKAIPSRLPAASLGNLPTQHPDHWTTQDLVGWLVSIKLPDVAQAFAGERTASLFQLFG